MAKPNNSVDAGQNNGGGSSASTPSNDQSSTQTAPPAAGAASTPPTAAPTSTTPPRANAAPPQPVLNFSKSSQIVSHLFKLGEAKVRKFTGWNEAQKDDSKQENEQYFQSFTHEHTYRTMTSQGERMDKCSPTAAHFHECKIAVDDKGNYILDGQGRLKIEVGPAKTTSGKKVILWPYDKPVPHTHQAVYVRSDEIQISSTSAEAFQASQSLDPIKRMGLNTQFPASTRQV